MRAKFVNENIKISKDTLEDLSDLEHDSWTKWMKYLFSKSKKNSDGSVTIPKDKVDRWERQCKTNYKNLTNKEKESDRKEVRKFIKVIKNENS